jgi:hypothetical protein
MPTLNRLGLDTAPTSTPPCPAAGTLTLNRLSLDKADVLSWGGGATPEEVLLWAALSARWANGDAIDRAVTSAVQGGRGAAAAFAIHRVVPFNPVDKMTSADVSAHCVARRAKRPIVPTTDNCMRCTHPPRPAPAGDCCRPCRPLVVALPPALAPRGSAFVPGVLCAPLGVPACLYALLP